MTCPIMEANKINRYCLTEPDDEANPCATCTFNMMQQRLADYHSDLIEETIERYKDEQACKQTPQN